MKIWRLRDAREGERKEKEEREGEREREGNKRGRSDITVATDARGHSFTGRISAVDLSFPPAPVGYDCRGPFYLQRQ